MRCRRARDELRVGSRLGAVIAPPFSTPTTARIHIAYRVFGEGSIDLVFVAGAMTNLDVLWEQPDYRRFCERLGSFSRLILFDKRGMGLSDRVQIGTLEERMDDVRAILDAVGSEQAVLLGRLRRRADVDPLRCHLSGTRPRADSLRRRGERGEDR